MQYYNGTRNDPIEAQPSTYAPPVQHRRSFDVPPPPEPPYIQPHGETPWKAFVYAFIMIVNILLLVLLGVLMAPQMLGVYWDDIGNYAFVDGTLLSYDAQAVAYDQQMSRYLAEEVIYPGVYVDGVHVGGMTLAEAEAKLGGAEQAVTGVYSLTVNVGDRSWQVDTSNVPASRNLGNVLEKAYALGRTNPYTAGSTPLEERQKAVTSLRENTVHLQSGYSYDREAVRTIAQEITSFVNRDPVDAQISSFDFTTRTFGFTQSSPGVWLDEEELISRICTELDKWECGLSITVPTVITEPTVTTEELQSSFKMISAFTTQTTKNDNRNTNIRLACEAVNGTALMPGETFSFNNATGERTAAKGYKEAAAIAKGESVDQIGGGVCQASSTLFNAVARANLQIVSRTPHAWPSSYVNKGEDATVDYPNLDFKFKNNTDSPIFIIMYYKNRKVSAEIWGLSLGEGVSIELESVVTQTLTPPDEVEYVYNASLPVGTSKTTVQKRTGYVVDTYQVWLKDGKETSRNKLHTSTYKAYQQVIEYNDGYGGVSGGY